MKETRTHSPFQGTWGFTLGRAPSHLGPDDRGARAQATPPRASAHSRQKPVLSSPRRKGRASRGLPFIVLLVCAHAPGVPHPEEALGGAHGLGGADPGGQRSRGSTPPPQPTCLLASKLSPEACRCPPGERVGHGRLATSPGDSRPRGRSLTRPSGGSDGMQTHPFATQPPSWPSCSPVPAWFLSVCWSSRTVTAEQVTNGWCRVLSCQRSPGGNVRGSQNGFITNLWPQR